ncbi:hypothetical protein [Actinacidiphila sp. ITFR-21]|uniref:hypothetical protein n=1 Tax=Actinacidiphila sp. ITFR-21 TaxID=3075199 RepID=UPI00288B7816|nr:hypothetical protein [Streptomyces sp. ITFR-21]WNI20370.1 hypothetical protein RLT57_32725 [Streptomyces sp. ITFR-21]
MTAPSPAPVADPRVAPLVSLVHTLIGEYVSMASTVAGHLPEGDKKAFGAHVQQVTVEVKAAITEIGAQTPQGRPGE